jgi:hypothetical protein
MSPLETKKAGGLAYGSSVRDGSNDHLVAENGGWACWTADSKWLYYAVPTENSYRIEKIPTDGGPPVLVRTDNAIGPAISPDNSTLYIIPARRKISPA